MTATPGTAVPELIEERLSRATGFVRAASVVVDEAAGALVVTLRGQFTIDEAPALWNRIGDVLDRGSRRAVRVELGEVETIDGACTALLVHLRNELATRGIRCELSGGAPAVRRIVELYAGRRTPRARRKRKPQNAVEQVGESTLKIFAEIVAMLDFLGQIVAAAGSSLLHPRRMNVRDVALTMERGGADAAPIVMLINFLIGFVMAYQSALQLEQFGAGIYVADLVGVSMTRELAPLMTAIILCGRTGAAFAAELGTMKVSEEVDALRTLGFQPLHYLVLPRIAGLMLVAPLLTLVADCVGIAGGLLVGHVTLDITPRAFWVELLGAVKPWDIWSGVLKSAVFAGAVGLIACQQGLATSGGAEGVGRRTTAAVVAILFMLILLDAVFTVVFGALGL
ncbi:MAG TPA: MlaE family lipid ABC transporter permease subunit [Polyangiaceae bacterium]|nr:MlaE family lipid ABC transporter permease subunit [Polyangiaceae bacterium]